MLEYGRFDIYWEGHATVRIADGDFTVAVDPFSPINGDYTADLILVTHGDAGHYDPEEIERISDEDTCVVVPEELEGDIPVRDVERLAEGDVIDVFGVEIEAFPMKNQLGNHSDGNGYRFRMKDINFYVAGDTGLSEDFLDLEGKVDMAFLPVEGEQTMDISDAVKASARIRPDVVVPYHYGEPFFSDLSIDLRGFKVELEDRNIRCELLEPENS